MQKKFNKSERNTNNVDEKYMFKPKWTLIPLKKKENVKNADTAKCKLYIRSRESSHASQCKPNNQPHIPPT